VISAHHSDDFISGVTCQFVNAMIASISTPLQKTDRETCFVKLFRLRSSKESFQLQVPVIFGMFHRRKSCILLMLVRDCSNYQMLLSRPFDACRRFSLWRVELFSTSHSHASLVRAWVCSDRCELHRPSERCLAIQTSSDQFQFRGGFAFTEVRNRHR